MKFKDKFCEQCEHKPVEVKEEKIIAGSVRESYMKCEHAGPEKYYAHQTIIVGCKVEDSK